MHFTELLISFREDYQCDNKISPKRGSQKKKKKHEENLHNHDLLSVDVLSKATLKDKKKLKIKLKIK